MSQLQGERENFWTLQAWPNDPVGYTFLARAFTRIGAALFGSEWSGIEGACGVPGEHGQRQLRARVALNRNQESDLWKAAESQFEELRAVTERRDAAIRQIAIWAENAELPTAWRLVLGGRLSSIDPSCWSTDEITLLQRLKVCQMYLDRPFEHVSEINPSLSMKDNAGTFSLNPHP
jgi:hypothetical protein